MKRMMLLVVLSLISSMLYAGYAATFEVTISGNLAYGSLRDVRYSSDSTQYISCYTQHPLGGSSYGSCMARNAAGTYKSCFTTDPGMLATIRSLGSTSDYVWFIANASGGCERISVVSGSHML
ncbi:hypothetical protein [Pleionea sp. CnH1-48]|uniref:hypothetical protein n=1 Tax=Pleionea sp. CnH1-48 TaxID=2954494 RepID=UPI002096F917|nr:hypothetical protein [Pleionea sp. CnH1-48]MCO7223185.1 hypothetical protein [Pleionea sp. CnH1-48]